MKQLRTDTGQGPQLGPARAWTRHGYGTGHVTRWLPPHLWRRCGTSGCANLFTPFDVCPDCGIPTDDMWED